MAAPTGSLVSSVLHEYGAVTRAVLFDYLPAAEPRRYLYDLVADYPRRGGRAFRPSLCIATARAFGAPVEVALQTAVSIELVHNAMLIHDDIEDESEQRRGKPTMHVAEGVPIAINVGDMLSLLSMRPLLDNRHTLGPELSLRILEETERMARESAEGQALELGWRRDNVTDVVEADYLFMVLKKTCWLATIHPSRMGSLIGTRGALDLDRCIRFGFFLGLQPNVHSGAASRPATPVAPGPRLVKAGTAAGSRDGSGGGLREEQRRRRLGRGGAHASASTPSTRSPTRARRCSSSARTSAAAPRARLTHASFISLARRFRLLLRHRLLYSC